MINAEVFLGKNRENRKLRRCQTDVKFKIVIYKGNQNKTLRPRSMKQNADFQEGVSQA